MPMLPIRRRPRGIGNWELELATLAILATFFLAPCARAEQPAYTNHADENLNASENWADFSAAAKEKLVGKTAKIVVPVQAKQDGPYEFKPLVVDGKEVVRPLTAEDVDTIGKACLFNSVNI